jgi:hypothetical protein
MPCEGNNNSLIVHHSGGDMTTQHFTLFILIALLLAACGGSDAPRVFFTNVEDGDTIQSPVLVEWSAENFTIEPAGEVHDNAGHLHVMVNTGCIAAGEVIPNDETHLHFGKAQTEAELALASGEYTLCLQAADGEHKALEGDGMTQVIKITVEP